MEIPKLRLLNNGSCVEKHIKKIYPEFHHYIIEKYPEDLNWTEKLYWYYHNINDYPICPICGNRVNFKSFSRGYHEFCSLKCACNSEITKEKIKQTNLKKYGVENTFQSKELKEKIKQTNLEKYGSEYPGQSEIVKEKIKQTNLEKYGCEYGLSCAEVKEKRKRTCLKRYGVENVFSSTEIKEKIKQTNIEKLGVEYPGQSDTVKEKIKQTNLEKYGTESPLQSSEILHKVQQTNIERYGFKTPAQSEPIKEKIKQSTFDHFGVEHPAQSPDILNKMKQTCIDKYGVDNYFKTNKFKKYIQTIAEQIFEKRKQTCIERYGVEFFSQSNEYIKNLPNILQKAYFTKKENDSFNSSKLEEDFSDWLIKNNIQFKRQYSNDKYPFACDFYFPEKDLYLEIQGSWTHGGHPFDPTNQLDVDIINNWKEKNTDYYNNAITVWTIKDPIKRKIADINKLNWYEIFSNNLNDIIDCYLKNFPSHQILKQGKSKVKTYEKQGFKYTIIDG